MAGVATLDALRAQNIALQVQLSSQERELAQCRHALNLAMTKAGSWGALRSRVVLSKTLNHVPQKAWPPRSSAESEEEGERATALIASLQAQLESAREETQRERKLRQEADAALAAARAVQQRKPDDAPAETSDAAPGKPSNALVAHLMAQITFLHDEVERLQAAGLEARQQGARDAEEAAKGLGKELIAREREIEKLRLEVTRARAGVARATGGGSVETDHAAVEELQRAWHDEKAQLLTDKTELQNRARKLEAALKSQKALVADAERAKERQAELAEVHAKDLHTAIAALSRERDSLRDELDSHRRRAATPRYSVDTQVTATPVAQTFAQTDAEEPTTVSSACQVGSLTVGEGSKGMDAGSGPDESSSSALAHALEQKCAELDAVRAQFEELRESSTFTAAATRRLQDALKEEADRRRAAEGEAERLGMQVRALQQHSSQLQVAIRDAQAATDAANSKAQEAIAASLRAEEERRVWESQLSSNARDMDSLVAQQAMANQQVAAAAAESDKLRDELQKALHREAQLQYEVKAKQAELTEVVATYQQCVREADTLANAVTAVERECDNLRGVVAVRDERVHGLSEQVEELHEREKRLTMDLQSVDYENSLLHRKLVAAENAATQLEAQLSESGQGLRACQRVIEDFERSHAELHKQLVVKENELMLARQRCDDAAREAQTASSSQRQASRRVQELEEANARLAVRGVMTRVAQESADVSADATVRQLQDSNAELQAANKELRDQLAETKRALEHVTATLNSENATVQVLRDEISELTEQRDALTAAQNRLEALVRSQAETLAGLEA